MSGDNGKPYLLIRLWLRAGLLRHLSPAASKVLFLLVDHGNKDGLSWPSADLLARLSGSTRKHVYVVLRQLEALGAIQRKAGAEGQTRFQRGNHPGPVYYWIRSLDAATEAKLKRKASRHHAQGDVSRFQSREVSLTQEHLAPEEMSLSQEQLEAERCSCERPRDVPEPALRDVPESALQGVPGPGTRRRSTEEEVRRSKEEDPPLPPLEKGGTSALGRPNADDAHALGLGKGNGKGTTKAAERDRESIRLFLEAEQRLGKGLKPLDYWFRWFPATYNRGMIQEEYGRLVRA